MSRVDDFNSFFHMLRLKRASSPNPNPVSSFQQKVNEAEKLDETVSQEGITYFSKLSLTSLDPNDSISFGIKVYDEDEESVEYATQNSKGLFTTGIMSINGNVIPVDKNVIGKLINNLKKFQSSI